MQFPLTLGTGGAGRLNGFCRFTGDFGGRELPLVPLIKVFALPFHKDKKIDNDLLSSHL